MRRRKHLNVISVTVFVRPIFCPFENTGYRTDKSGHKT